MILANPRAAALTIASGKTGREINGPQGFAELDY
jgi:hypothetical protein